MPKHVTLAEVDQAEAELAHAKKGKDHAKRHEAMQRVADLRTAYRTQEQDAGRRSGFVGGDATRTEG